MKKEFVRWSAREIEVLKKWFPREGIAVKKRLKRRTIGAIKARALMLGLPNPNKKRSTGNGRKLLTLGEEIAVLEKYEKIGGTALAKELGRPVSSITTKAQQFGLKSPHPQHDFTEEEIAILREPHSVRELCKLLPRHTKNSIIRKRIDLGCSVLKCVPWSAEEDAILREHYPTEGAAVVSQMLGRTTDAVWGRCKKLGIHREGRKCKR